MDFERDWRSPPYFAVIRGPFGRAGYQVATVARDGDTSNKVVLLYTCRQKAEDYLRGEPQGHSDWTVGTLPSWERVAFFLGSMKQTASRVCLDFDRDASDPGIAWPLEEVLPEFERRAAGELRSDKS